MRNKPYDPDGSQKLEAIRLQLGLTASDFSLALGYKTAGGCGIAIRNKTVTQLIVLAAEGLLARQAASHQHERPIVRLILTILPDGSASTEPFQAEEAVFQGRKYLMVPAA